jgi:hypothetical protein
VPPHGMLELWNNGQKRITSAVLNRNVFPPDGKTMVPIFHHSMRLIKKMALRNIVIPIDFKNSETSN